MKVQDRYNLRRRGIRIEGANVGFNDILEEEMNKVQVEDTSSSTVNELLRDISDAGRILETQLSELVHAARWNFFGRRHYEEGSKEREEFVKRLTGIRNLLRDFIFFINERIKG